jgi:hypothetical protein
VVACASGVRAHSLQACVHLVLESLKLYMPRVMAHNLWASRAVRRVAGDRGWSALSDLVPSVPTLSNLKSNNAHSPSVLILGRPKSHQRTDGLDSSCNDTYDDVTGYAVGFLECIHEELCIALFLFLGARKPHLHAEPHRRHNVGLKISVFDVLVEVGVA